MWGALIAAAVGGTINAISGISGRRKARKQLREDRDNKLAELALQYDIAEKNARKNADRQDDQSDLNEKFIAGNANNQLDALRNAQEQEAFAFNQQAMQDSSQEGSALASMATSGTRNSSMKTAVELQSAVNSQQLQLSEDSTRASDENSLFNILNNFQNDAFKLQNDRTDAEDLRDAYVEGSGDQWKLYDMSRQGIKREYDRAIDEQKTSFWSVVGDFFGGAKQGYDVGSAVSGFMRDASAYKTMGNGNSTMSFNNLSQVNYYSTNKNLGSRAMNFMASNVRRGVSSLQYGLN
jgi:hypothetical protein